MADEAFGDKQEQNMVDDAVGVHDEGVVGRGSVGLWTLAIRLVLWSIKS